MDFSQFNTVQGSEEGKFLHLRDPKTGQHLVEGDENVGLLLRGIDSKNYRARLVQTSNKYLKSLTSRRTGFEGDDIDAAAVEVDLLDRLVACFISASRVENRGAPVKTAEDFRNLLQDCPWVREQADAFVGDRKNFLPKQETRS